MLTHLHQPATRRASSPNAAPSEITTMAMHYCADEKAGLRYGRLLSHDDAAMTIQCAATPALLDAAMP